MGGGGGGSSLTPDELKKLEEIAKKVIKEGAVPKKRSIFISFAGEDLNEVNLLRGQAKNENSDLEFIDRSLQKPFDSKDAEYIKRGIRERIRQSSITVCYLSENTAQSKWVDWEIRESIALGKGVIAMYKGDSPPAKIPSAIKEFKIKLVSWTHKRLSQAIDIAAKTKK
jgi:hypothetical protein